MEFYTLPTHIKKVRKTFLRGTHTIAHLNTWKKQNKIFVKIITIEAEQLEGQGTSGNQGIQYVPWISEVIGIPNLL